MCPLQHYCMSRMTFVSRDAPCAPGSISPSGVRRNSIPLPSTWGFLGEPNSNSTNATLNPRIVVDALKCHHCPHSAASIPTNVESGDFVTHLTNTKRHLEKRNS